MEQTIVVKPEGKARDAKYLIAVMNHASNCFTVAMSARALWIPIRHREVALQHGYCPRTEKLAW
jgi:hypothetical protein